MKRKTKTKTIRRHRILDTISAIELMVMLLGMSGMDSEDLTVPVIMIAQALIWFVLFCPKDWFDGEGEQ